MVITAILSARTSSLKAETVSIIQPPDHRRTQTTCRAGRHQTKSPPRRRSSCSVWVIIRAPVAAKG
jgi:hypothetical protein